jgi:hypothetical protein
MSEHDDRQSITKSSQPEGQPSKKAPKPPKPRKVERRRRGRKG